ncbi:hypothetical protein PRJ_Fausto_00486 [Faustovirus]|nr:hypothetical protein PRJ_Fausto_00486 [Faustovirus]
MDNCILPIELIEIICKHDHTNWVTLIRTCKKICECLMPLRWDVKSEINYIHIPTKRCHGYVWNLLIRYGCEYKCNISVRDRGDYWEMLNKTIIDKNGHMVDECVYFAEGKVHSILYMHAGNRVGKYMMGAVDGRRYCDGGSWSPSKVYFTKADLMARLDKLGVRYNWLKYLKDEN